MKTFTVGPAKSLKVISYPPGGPSVSVVCHTRVSTSLDAILTLVGEKLPGWGHRIYQAPTSKRYGDRLVFELIEPDVDGISCTAATAERHDREEALAASAALLKALEERT